MHSIRLYSARTAPLHAACGRAAAAACSTRDEFKTTQGSLTALGSYLSQSQGPCVQHREARCLLRNLTRCGMAPQPANVPQSQEERAAVRGGLIRQAKAACAAGALASCSHHASRPLFYIISLAIDVQVA